MNETPDYTAQWTEKLREILAVAHAACGQALNGGALTEATAWAERLHHIADIVALEQRQGQMKQAITQLRAIVERGETPPAH